MNLNNRLSASALALILATALPVPALAQSVQDFQLPPAPTPSATPRVQGPVDEGVPPQPARPLPIRTAVPAPTPTVSIPVPTPSATPAAQPEAAAGQASARSRDRSTPVQSRTAPAASAKPGAVAPLEPQPLESTQDLATPPASAVPLPLPSPPATSPVAGGPTLVAGDMGAGFWPWLGALAALMLAGAGAWMWRRRLEAVPPPTIEPPLVRAAPEPAPTVTEPAPKPAPATTDQPLNLQATAVKLTRSFAFATLDYQLTLINRTSSAMSDLTISADLVSAHGNAPVEEQVAQAATEMPKSHEIARLAPGQSQQLTGKVQLPINDAHVIRQGSLPLFVPLLRLRVDRLGDAPMTRTFIIGQGAQDGSRLQPFRLDEGPRTYSPISQRVLDLG